MFDADPQLRRRLQIFFDMKYCTCKEIDKLVKRLIGQGWIYRWGGKNGRLSSPNGRAMLFVPCTPSDRRAFLNFRRDVRHVLEGNTLQVVHQTGELKGLVHRHITA